MSPSIDQILHSVLPHIEELKLPMYSRAPVKADILDIKVDPTTSGGLYANCIIDTMGKDSTGRAKYGQHGKGRVLGMFVTKAMEL